jgi:hypothetical protein
VYLNQKRNSKSAIAEYHSNKTAHLLQHIEAINALTNNCIQETDLESFTRIIDQHEILLSSILNTETVKKTLFHDFDGAINSLGAWGGDFVLVVAKENPSSYFIDKGYETVIAYDHMIL